MSLGFPLGLLGLLSLPVIVALHMIRERQKQYVVSSLKLWAFLEPEVHGTRPRKTPLTWLLVVDLLLASLFSLALAQPSVKLPTNQQGAKNLIILLDNSTSMLTRDSASTRFSLAQADAIQLISGLGGKDSASVFSFNSVPAWVGDTDHQNVQEIIAIIQQLKAGATGNSLRLALALGKERIGQDIPNEFHVFTDAAYEDPEILDFRYPIVWHFYGEQTSNQAVIDLSVRHTKNNLFQVYAELANFGDVEVARNVTLFLDDEPVDSLSVRFPPNSVLSQVWVQQGEPSSVSVSLMGGDFLKEDDQASMGFRGLSKPRIVIVADEPGVLGKIQDIVQNADVQIFASGDYFMQPAINLTIVKEDWLDVWPNGVVLMTQPPRGSFVVNGETFNILNLVTNIPVETPIHSDRENPILSEIDFSGVRWGSVTRFEGIPKNFEVILQADMNEPVPLLLRGKVGQSTVYILMSDLEQGNLSKHPAFPILLAKLTVSSLEQSIPIAILLGEEIPLPDPSIVQNFVLTDPEGNLSEYSKDWQKSQPTIGLPGLYELEIQDKEGVETNLVVGVIAGEIIESNNSPAAWFKTVPNGVSEVPADNSPNIQLTPWLLGLSIVLFIVEAILAWR